MKRLEWSLLSEDNSARILFAFSPSTAHNLCLRTPRHSLQHAERAGFYDPNRKLQSRRPYLLAEESQSCSRGRN